MRLIPKRLFVINMLITSIYTIGVLSALYAGLLAAGAQYDSRHGFGFDQRNCDHAAGHFC